VRRSLATTPPPPSPASSGFSGLMQRITSFVVGAGVTALVTQFYLFEEIRTGNLLLLQRQNDIDTRLKNLELKR
jgi:hypothetical protein